jgi:DNA repair exonuclease SbcCD ATPase subunit
MGIDEAEVIWRQIEELEKMLGEKETEVSKTEDEIIKLEEMVTAKTSELSKLREELRIEEARTPVITKWLGKLFPALIPRLTELRRKIMETEAAIRDAGDRLKILTELRKRLEGEIKAIKEKIEELKKRVPKVGKFVRMTFSIQTGVGNEVPFFCEVTARTVVSPIEKTPTERIANLCLKYFWILFDVWKDLRKEHKSLLGTVAYESLAGWIKSLQKYKDVIEEKEIDDVIDELVKTVGAFIKPKEEYATYEDVIKVGVEEIPVKEPPTFPELDVSFEKKELKPFTSHIKLILDKITKIDIMKLLGIKYKEERK